MKTILVVEDSQFFQVQLKRILEDDGYDVICVDNGEDALQSVHDSGPDLVVLGVEMPGMNGFEVTRILRNSPVNNLLPIILVTAREDQEDKLTGLELGADDYITKPFNERELLSRIRNTLRRIDRNRGANPLTGLQGYAEIQRVVDDRLRKKERLSVINIDVDNFKAFNEKYGFPRGDAVIQMCARILANVIEQYGNETDFYGHVSGDNFVIVTTPDSAETLSEKFIAEFDEQVKHLHAAEDLENGYYAVSNRRGETERHPITTVSLAISTNKIRELRGYAEVMKIVSELNRVLKNAEGSRYMVDRRKK